MIKIFGGEGADENQLEALAEKLNTEVIKEAGPEIKGQLLLQVDKNGVSLRKDNLMMQGDFSKMLSRVKPGKLKEERLFKASKINGLTAPMTAIDATAGMAEDTLIIAAAGYQVKLFEKDPVIAVLLKDAMERGMQIPELAPILSRMELVEGDSIEAMKSCGESGDYPDLIYLDPMFPARSKSGLIKKKFQLLQQLEQPAEDGDDMLQAAIAAHPRKIVVKRPLKGEYLGGVKPGYSIPGKAIRYDCLLFPR